MHLQQTYALVARSLLTEEALMPELQQDNAYISATLPLDCQPLDSSQLVGIIFAFKALRKQ
jgi:hypothetical protein